MLSGAKLGESFEPAGGYQCASLIPGGCGILIKPDSKADFRLQINRSQQFSNSELRVAKAFIEVLSEISEHVDAAFGQDLLNALPRRVVARCVGGHLVNIVVSVIDGLESWSSQTYEGQRITSAIGIEPKIESSKKFVTVRMFFDRAYSAVLTNGIDTVITFGNNGRLLQHLSLDSSAANSCAPFRYAAIANWAIDGRRAFALSRGGEILVFENGRLVFAKRSGVWHHLVHEPVITQMALPQNPAIRQAVYESCLDVSFARTGGCIAVVGSSHRTDVLRNGAIHERDMLTQTSHRKPRLLNTIVAGRPFQDLDRRLRQELLAMDGATVIDHRGQILAAGAIANVPSGSAGGGRLAAAIELGKYGLGIKISQEGPIRGYRGGSANEVLAIC